MHGARCIPVEFVQEVRIWSLRQTGSNAASNIGRTGHSAKEEVMLLEILAGLITAVNRK